jgi:glycosyltransferase involved in cell wall biosynthesis
MKFSIIVPVFNVKEYLVRCLDSLVYQNFQDFEIVIVNDGSTDGSDIICNNYIKKYSNIKLINQSNSGLSSARNTGLKNSSGEYILFVDSDDFIESDTLSTFSKYLNDNKFDVIVGSAKVLVNNNYYSRLTFTELNNLQKIHTGIEFFKFQLKLNTMHMPVWLYIYNRSFLSKNLLDFKVGILHEDEEFTPRALFKVQSLLFLNYHFYNYILRKNSITNTKSKIINSLHIIQTCIFLKEFYSKVDDNEFRYLLLNSLATKYFYAFQISRVHRSSKFVDQSRNFFKGIKLTNKNKLKQLLFYFNKTIFFSFFYFVNRIRFFVKFTRKDA